MVELWSTPPADVAPEPSIVHVWRACLDRATQELPALQCVLSTDELARADQFVFRHLRDRFVTVRGLLRTILGRCVDADPRELQFRYNANGKPALAASSGGEALQRVALAWIRPVGLRQRV